MKKLLSLVACISFFLLLPKVQSQDLLRSPQSSGSWKWSRSTFDFGYIPVSQTTNHTFKFVNSGETPIQIDQIQSTCQDVVLEFSEGKIQPQKSGHIKVYFTPESGGEIYCRLSVIEKNQSTFQVLLLRGIAYHP